MAKNWVCFLRLSDTSLVSGDREREGQIEREENDDCQEEKMRDKHLRCVYTVQGDGDGNSGAKYSIFLVELNFGPKVSGQAKRNSVFNLQKLLLKIECC